MKRRKLTAQESEDARRLSALWEEFQRANPERTQAWLAKECGWKTQGAAQQYLRGLVPLNLTAALKIARAIGRHVREFSPRLAAQLDAFDVGVVEAANAIAEAKVAKDYLSIPQLEIRASMGTGIALPEDHVNIVRRVTVSLSELRREVSFSAPQNLSLLTGIGNSMEDTFSDGDVLLVDEGVTEIKVDAVYVLEKAQELYIKTLQRVPEGLLMISDNKRYAPILIRDAERDQFKVRGRVLLAWNRRKL